MGAMQSDAEKSFLGMCRAMSWDPEEVRRRSKNLDIVVMKTVISRRMRELGYSHRIIGNTIHINKSTVIHHLKKFPTKYENKLFEQLTEKLKNGYTMKQTYYLIRQPDGTLWLCFTKPIKCAETGIWALGSPGAMKRLHDNDFPEVKNSSKEPCELEMNLIVKPNSKV